MKLRTQEAGVGLVRMERLLYLNLEDDRLGETTVETLNSALELFYRLNPESRTERSFLFFDEIQVVPGWEPFLRRVVDTENAEVYVTGSSAKLLSTEVATSFRGRGFASEILPFSLRETARYHGIEIDGVSWPPGAAARSRLEALCDQYLERGGFPEVQNLLELHRVQMLQDYVELVLLKDVAERYNIGNLVALRSLAGALFASTAGPFSISKLHGTLVSRGIKVGKPTLLAYLEHLRDAYLLFMVAIRSRSEKQRMVNPRKVYFVDTGLAAAMRTGGALNQGTSLENFVYLELRRRLGRLADRAISYYRTASGKEVDFAIDPVTAGQALSLVGACVSLQKPETRKRELEGMTEAMGETGVGQATLVTMADRERIETDGGLINVVPAWEWALAPTGE